MQPDFAAALNYLGYMNADRRVKVAEAVGLIEKAIALDPENGAYLDSLGWALFRQDRAEPGRGLPASRGREGEPAPSCSTTWATCSRAQGKMAEALEVLGARAHRRGRGRRPRPPARWPRRSATRRPGWARRRRSRSPDGGRRAIDAAERGARGALRAARRLLRDGAPAGSGDRGAGARRLDLQRTRQGPAGRPGAARARDRAARVLAARTRCASSCPARAGCDCSRSRRSGSVTAVFPSERAVYAGAADAPSMEALLGVALTPAEVMDLLLGTAPARSDASRVPLGTAAAAVGRRPAARTARACGDDRGGRGRPWPCPRPRSSRRPPRDYRRVDVEEARGLWSR